MRAIALLIAALWCGTFAQDVTTVRMIAHASWGIPPKDAVDPSSLARRAIFDEFHRQNPDVRVVNAAGLEVAGNQPDAPFLMSMAGDTAPDVFYVNFRQMTNYIEQGFCRPLDDLIAKDPQVLSRIKPKIQEVLRGYDGKVYCIPYIQYGMALYYRIDYYRNAGLDPSNPPRTWDEFYEYAKKLTIPEKGRYGFLFNNAPEGKSWHWMNILRQAGGEAVQRTETGFWKCVFNTQQGATALDFFRKLTLAKWERNGKMIGPAAGLAMKWYDDIDDGKAAMWFNYTNDVLLHASRTNPALIGVAAMPAGPGGHANEINAGMWAINASITDPKKLDACWRFIKFFSGDDAARIATNTYVDYGMGNLVSPELLRKFGHDDVAARVDPLLVKANKELFESGKPEPSGRNCQMLYVLLDEPLQEAVLNPETPAKEILDKAAKEIDAKLLGFVGEAEMQRRRGFAVGILAFIGAGIAFLIYRWVRAIRRRPPDEGPVPASRSKRLAAFFVAPAAISLLVWAYYPLARGLLIAFQDYRIMKPAHYVGVDNFIEVFTAGTFWKGLMNSFIFVALTIGIGFFIPFLLALALNEIPRFKVFFRTIFYLPAMTSGVVIAFMWRTFYDKTEAGFLNQLLLPVFNGGNWIVDHLNAWFGWEIHHFPRTHDWLGDPSLAMLAVVIPGIWAGAGPASILYLAALKNVPEERYEAADLDGASWRHKIRYITYPALRPLILINLLGAFIGGFKAMEQIFVMTGGGPLYATHTLGLEVWQNAFMFLKFGYATAAAWVMGAILIGFTVMQIKSLLQMKFTASSHA